MWTVVSIESAQILLRFTHTSNKPTAWLSAVFIFKTCFETENKLKSFSLAGITKREDRDSIEEREFFFIVYIDSKVEPVLAGLPFEKSISRYCISIRKTKNTSKEWIEDEQTCEVEKLISSRCVWSSITCFRYQRSWRKRCELMRWCNNYISFCARLLT